MGELFALGQQRFEFGRHRTQRQLFISLKREPWQHMVKYRIVLVFNVDEVAVQAGHPSRKLVAHRGQVGFMSNNDPKSVSTCHLHASGSPEYVHNLLKTVADLGLVSSVSIRECFR